jgi:integrase
MRRVETRKARDGGEVYVVRFRYGVSKKDPGKPRQTSERFDTRKQAAEFAKRLDAVGAQEALDWLYHGEQKSEVPTLSQIAADHIESLSHVEPGTRHRYAGIWSRTWGPLVGQSPVDRVSIDDLRRAVAVLAPRYSEKTMKNARGLLHAVLDRAVSEGHVPTNVAKRRLKLPTGGGHDREDMRILTLEEYLALEAAISPNYRPLLRFLWGTGCRWGEAVALTVADVRLPNVTIRRAQKYAPGEYRIGAPKTRRGRRTIALPAELHDELRALCADKSSSDLVFTSVQGQPIRHRTFWDRYWRPAVAVVPEPRPRIHDLRHSHASWLLGRGVPIHVVQARLGHESIKTTVDTYSHLLPDAQRLAADAASLAFAPMPRQL